MDSSVEDNWSIVLVIDEWVGECTVRFWKTRSSNNDHMARCQGCSMDCQWTICFTSTMVHWQTFTMNGFKWKMVVCQIPISLPAEVDVDRHKDCDMSANQSRCSKLSRLHKIISQFLQRLATAVRAGASCMINSVLPRDMHAATVMSSEIAMWWVCGLPGPPILRIPQLGHGLEGSHVHPPTTL